MIRKLSVIEGLGGTGKTHTIKEIVRQNPDRQIIYLCFNRKLKNRMVSILNTRNVTVRTIHGLCFQELKAIGRLPDAFAEVEDFDTDEELSSKAFNELLHEFTSTFGPGTYTLSSIGESPILIIDEYQNLDSALIEVVKAIGRVTESELIIAGDRYQSLFDYQEGHTGKENFGKIEADFDRQTDARIVLRKNWRTRTSILAFINGFLQKNLRIDEEMKYEVPDREEGEILPSVTYFTTKDEEAEYVKSRIERISGKKTVAILSRYKRDLRPYTSMSRESGITVSTVHSFIGNEADIVFIVGYQPPESEEECKVFYTGILRAKEELHISSSYPKTNPERIFEEETFTLEDRQENTFLPFRKFKLIRENANLTIGKFNTSMVDSICIKVGREDVPFFPYVRRDLPTKVSFEKAMFVQVEPVAIKVTYHTATGGYFFSMTDTNLLRRSGYDDVAILRYLSNIVAAYFDYRVTYSQMHVHRIDIAKMFHREDLKLREMVSEMGHGFRRRTDLASSVKPIMEDVMAGRTEYVDLSKEMKVALYRPVDKENQNKFHNPQWIKAELRISGQGIGRSICKGLGTVEEIFNGIRQGTKMTDHWERVIRYFLHRKQRRVLKMDYEKSWG